MRADEVTAPTAAAQVRVSYASEWGLWAPPYPFQREIGTIASNPMPSAASARCLTRDHSVVRAPGMEVKVMPGARLVPNVPSCRRFLSAMIGSYLCINGSAMPAIAERSPYPDAFADSLRIDDPDPAVRELGYAFAAVQRLRDADVAPERLALDGWERGFLAALSVRGAAREGLVPEVGRFHCSHRSWKHRRNISDPLLITMDPTGGNRIRLPEFHVPSWGDANPKGKNWMRNLLDWIQVEEASITRDDGWSPERGCT